MTLADRLAALHADAFDGPSRWSSGAFRSALENPHCFLTLSETDTGGPIDGFALGRCVADEAELLTLLVADGRKRQGLGRDLLAQFEAAARVRGAQAVFLEVSAENAAARALYDRSGWRLVGQRSGYYEGVDALAMRKDL
ncbi:GNAT family N-acetyltransferase [Jannaschia sp. M317]|uniref:GNAT family N-acetyltransferase n=1 Tax=Jannaschia sp. M317 TaxID=2867011 RepID=UPI0021A83BF4|nr:GNAT family N-acetyltransferase [Jannaschia sp. M317]UWQ18690.1 GNAT family N-acetyltransferase [Jannaschia sp. M317]